MKRQSLILILFLLPLIALWGCEGEQGPAGLVGANGTNGTDGVNGVDGNMTCLECHDTDLQNSISLQYDRSQHGLGDIAVDYAGSLSYCAKCHAGNGYVEWAETGTVDANFTTPEAFTCNTCHAVHTTFEDTDYALRMDDPVTWIFDETTTYDFEDNSNVCAWCHQNRRAEPLVTNPGEDTFVITSSHYGTHHGPQSNVLAGVGMAEFEGSFGYAGAFSSHADAGITCVDCHMGTYTDGEGGHTFLPNLVNCTTCHQNATDYNIGNVQTATAGLLEELRDLLLAQGVIVEEDGSYHPLLDDPDVLDADNDGDTTELMGYITMDQARAFFNWIGLEEDRSLGVHNPGYVEALLENSIAAISP